MCLESLIFNLLVGQSLSKQVTVTNGHDGAITVRTARNEHVIRAPGKVVDRCIVDVADHGDWMMLVRRVDDNLIRGGHGENHPVGQFQKGSLVASSFLFVIEVRVELNARGVSLQTWKHEGWLA